ncbi:hypothetical protein BDR04DRAFT_1119910 [Suillus decipiens]|nr:hypothetical protein BDR04DRAFT_1119910 [Suillus decipiens]
MSSNSLTTSTPSNNKGAISRNFPMDGKYSLRPYMDIGMAIFNTYAHIPGRVTKMWISLHTILIVYIDDSMDKGEDFLYVYSFYECFARNQPQSHPILTALDVFLRDVILTDLAQSYPDYMRMLSAIPTAYSLFIFPSTLPLREYEYVQCQCMPDLAIIINYTNNWNLITSRIFYSLVQDCQVLQGPRRTPKGGSQNSRLALTLGPWRR